MKKTLLMLSAFVLQMGIVNAQVNLSTDLVGDYSFSGDAKDASTSINNGTVNGAALANDRGTCSSSSYSFDGIDDNISISGTGLNNSNYSYSAWVYVNSNPSSGNATAILSIGNTGGDQAILLTNSYSGVTGFTASSYYASYTGPNLYATGTSPTTGKWYHLVAVRDNTTLKLYVNGTLSGQVSTGSNLPYYESPYLGAFGARTDNIQNFNGRIDDVKLYSRAINSCEVAALYALSTINLNNGLIGNYPFSGNSNDLSKFKNNGTVNGATLAADRYSASNSAYSFDGINDNISISSTGLTNNNFTYSAWVYINTLPTSGNAAAILSIGYSGSDQTLSLYNNYGGFTGFSISTYYQTSPVTNGGYSTGTLPSVNTWYYLTFTRDNSSIKLYVNGSLVGTTSTGGKLAAYNTPVNAKIGSRSNNVQYFNGRIDDVRIYDRALADCEVSATYNTTTVTTNPNGLVGSYYFNGNQNDLSGNGNHGTANNGTSLTTNRFSTSNAAYSFDGTDDNITISGTGLNKPNYSYSAWVYVNSGPSSGNAAAILSIGNTGGDQAILLTNSYSGVTGFAASSYYAAYTGPNLYATGTSPTTGTWYHLVAVRDSTTLKLYVDGTLSGQVSTGTNLPYYETPYLGAIGSRTDNIQYFNGRIDDVRIYNRAITSCEIQKLYSETSGSNPSARQASEIADVSTTSDTHYLAYPNPSNGNFSINTNGLEKGTYTFTLLNQLGQPVNIKIDYATDNITTNNLAKGIYLLLVNSETEKKQQKIVIE